MKRERSEYTKGPWIADGADILAVETRFRDKDAPLATMNVESALWVQDALLIAASPELLEFVKHVLSQIESGACGYVDASEAELKSYAQSLINKAEGNEK
jgi:hypothetical protein